MSSIPRPTDAAEFAGAAIRVRGVVQGVGFRPTIWRLARDCGLVGDVRNDSDGVLIRVWGDAAALDRFIQHLRDDAPPLARIDTVECTPLADSPSADDFRIVASGAGQVRTNVAPDAAICRACVDEMVDRLNRRYRYPFINCTHCGPRLSIVRGIPYDRANTSMATFLLCEDCRAEYEDPADRRFHAEPNACSRCGPKVWLENAGGEPVVSAARSVDEACNLIQQGKIVAIKGIGGFHLACDAGNSEAVERLRRRKKRYRKAFALMARDFQVIERYCTLTPSERALLANTVAPIVLCQANGAERLPEAVAPGLNTLGFMLPYTALHCLLLRRLEQPIVLTSGNLSDEPQCTGNQQATTRLRGIADCFLLHDRDIVNRIDDSVVRVMDGAPRVLRRARGYAPAPLGLPAGFADAPPILALGGELKNTFCLIRDGQAILSQHQGDLEDAATYADYRHHLELYQTLFDHEPRWLAIDKHPEYLATKLAREWSARKGLPLVEAQHHHAHIASCLAENGVALDAPPVLGVALDGLGMGDDGQFWGGEFLLADYRGFQRLASLKPVAMIGGSQAMREPWRNTYAHLLAAFDWRDYEADYGGLELSRFLDSKPLKTLSAMLEQNINCPTASSCGRLFDAVAAAIGVCREEASYEGQAAVELEVLAESAAQEDAGYAFDLMPGETLSILDPGPMWRQLLDDLLKNVAPRIIAARFHNGLARAIAATVATLSLNAGGPTTVALSGGVFQNKLLLEQVSRLLRKQGFTVLTHSQIPANDGGLSLGQASIAAARVLTHRGAPCV